MIKIIPWNLKLLFPLHSSQRTAERTVALGSFRHVFTALMYFAGTFWWSRISKSLFRSIEFQGFENTRRVLRIPNTFQDLLLFQWYASYACSSIIYRKNLYTLLEVRKYIIKYTRNLNYCKTTILSKKNTAILYPL